MQPTYTLPLFPLNVVICPDGLITLRIFEARYLDMVRNCLRAQSPFGIMTVLPQEEMPDAVFPFGVVGTSMTIVEADVQTVGLIYIRCRGQHRFEVKSVTQQADGLYVGEVQDIPNDQACEVPPDLQKPVADLKRMIDSLLEQGMAEDDIPFAKPYQFDDCGWVANRWVERLNLSLADKHRLMALPSPVVRLELIQDELDKWRTE